MTSAGERRRVSSTVNEALAGYLFVLPALAIFLIFFAGPLLAAFGLSLTSYDVIRPPRPVGFANFQVMLGDVRFRTVLANTVVFTVVVIVVNTSLGLVLAILLNRRLPRLLRYLLRTAYFFPVMVGLAFVAVIWRFMMSQDTGVLNYFLAQVGIRGPDWLNSASWTLWSVLILDIWKNVGFSMLIFLAALQNVPPELEEAARVDGAASWPVFRHITVPMISPAILFIVSINTVGSLQIFDSILVLTRGGPGDASRSLVYYIYEVAFGSFKFGYASALGVVLFILIAIATLVQFRLARSRVHYG
jgi:multiple sugar transport system permease protein